MKKQNVVFTKFNYPNEVCSVTLNNIGQHPELMSKIPVIIDSFTPKSELFIGSYKRDGFLLTDAQIEQFSIDIPKYFKKFGEVKQMDLIDRQSNPNKLVGGLYVFRAPVSEKTYHTLNKVFMYFLETIVFSPKINWNTFVDSYREYTKYGTRNYIQKGYADFMFSFVDSGDFTISFKEETMKAQLVTEKIQELLF